MLGGMRAEGLRGTPGSRLPILLLAPGGWQALQRVSMQKGTVRSLQPSENHHVALGVAEDRALRE